MPTLGNINGATLAALPQFYSAGSRGGGGGGAGLALGRGIKAMRDRESALGRQQEMEGIGQDILAEDADPRTIEAGLLKIGQYDPDYARAVGGVLASRDQKEVARLNQQNKETGRFAASLVGLDPVIQQNMLFEKAAQYKESGNPAAAGEYYRMGDMAVKNPERFGAELQQDISSSGIADELIKQYGFGGDSDNRLEIRKETRKDVRSRVNEVGKEAGVITTNYNKLKNLTGEIIKGNRSAVSQALVSLVKIGDPTSVVKESEMVAALNKKDPVAAVAQLLISKGSSEDVAKSVTDKIDPLDPNNINTDELLNTASAMISANMPSLMGRFDEAKQLGSAQLTKQGYDSIFNKALVDRITSLNEFVPSESSPPPQEIPDGATATNAQGEKIIYSNGKWSPI